MELAKTCVSVWKGWNLKLNNVSLGCISRTSTTLVTASTFCFGWQGIPSTAEGKPRVEVRGKESFSDAIISRVPTQVSVVPACLEWNPVRLLHDRIFPIKNAPSRLWLQYFYVSTGNHRRRWWWGASRWESPTPWKVKFPQSIQQSIPWCK